MENIYDIQPLLHNLMTKTVVNEKSRQKILNVFKTRTQEYLSSRNERCIGRSRKLTTKISKIKSHSLGSLKKNNDKFSQGPETLTSKDISLAQRKIDIVSMQCMVKEEILSHDLFDDSILSDFSSTTTKVNKSLIAAEIKKDLLLTTALTKFKKDLTSSTLKIVDFMFHVRQRRWIFYE